MDRPPSPGVFARIFRRSAPPSDAMPAWRRRTGLWMVLYVLVSSAAFSPGISFRAARLKPGTIAERDFVAPRDFILPDPEATERKRGEAAAAVLPVYDRDTQAATRLEEVLRSSFEAARAA